MRRRWLNLRWRQESFGQAICCHRTIDTFFSTDVEVIGQMRGLHRKRGPVAMNFIADFNQAEAIEVPLVVTYVFKNARNQRGAEQTLLGGDRVEHTDVRGRVEADFGGLLFADE